MFDYNSTDGEVPNNQWNNHSLCFDLFGREYQLLIVMNSKCGVKDNKAFIAVDEIKIRETTGDDLDTICQDFKITEPTVIFTTQQDSTQDISSSTVSTNNISNN